MAILLDVWRTMLNLLILIVDYTPKDPFQKTTLTAMFPPSHYMLHPINQVCQRVADLFQGWVDRKRILGGYGKLELVSNRVNINYSPLICLVG